MYVCVCRTQIGIVFSVKKFSSSSPLDFSIVEENERKKYISKLCEKEKFQKRFEGEMKFILQDFEKQRVRRSMLNRKHIVVVRKMNRYENSEKEMRR
jgi:hypothetical protein